MEDEDREDLEAAVALSPLVRKKIQQPERCAASSWYTRHRGIAPQTYGPKGFNRCTRTASHLGDHVDEFGQVFRLMSDSTATIVRMNDDGSVSPNQKQVTDGWFDVPRNEVEAKEQEAEDARLRGTRFGEVRDFPGMEGFTIEMGDEAPDTPTSRLIHIIQVHAAEWISGRGEAVCSKDGETFPCETVRLALGLD